MTILKLYALTAVFFMALDFVWLTMVAMNFYQIHLGHLLRIDPLPAAAGAFYLVYIGGILVFAVLPGLEDGSLIKTTLLGGFLGIVAFGTFDLTCFALFVDFPLIVVVVDLVWGFSLTAAVSAYGFLMGRWLGWS